MYNLIYLVQFRIKYVYVFINTCIDSPTNDSASNSGIFKSLNYNKQEDDKIKINKEFRSDSLSRSQYNKVS